MADGWLLAGCGAVFENGMLVVGITVVGVTPLVDCRSVTTVESEPLDGCVTVNTNWLFVGCVT